MVHTKRIAAGYGKKHKWVTTPNPGKHKKEDSIPLMLVVRDILGYADTSREAKKIIHDGLIFVDKKPRKDPKYGIGLMDVIDIPKANKHYRAILSKKGPTLSEFQKEFGAMNLRPEKFPEEIFGPIEPKGSIRSKFILKDIDERESNIKLCKIMNKTLLGKGSIQLTLHDGSNILAGKNSYNAGDTIIFDLQNRKITDVIKFEKNNLAMIVHGRHKGNSGKISEIIDGTITRKSLTRIGDFQTLTDYIFVIGKDEPLI